MTKKFMPRAFTYWFRPSQFKAIAIAVCLFTTLLSMAPSMAASPNAIAALGFVEPERGLIHVSGALSADGSVVFQLNVKEGDGVEAGQVIAVLNNHDRLRAALSGAEAQLSVAEAKLQQILAGPRKGDIAIQQAQIQKLQAQLTIAKKECERYKKLSAKGTASASALERSCLEENVLTSTLTEGRARLADIQNIREVDVAILRAEVKNAEVAIEQAQANYALSQVRSPTDGQILRIYTQPGETISNQGIVGIGNTQQMWVRAEVYEADIGRVKPGLPVVVSADGLDTELNGEVAEIGLLVGRNQVLALEPTANVDARVVEVKIRLSPESSEQVRSLTNMQVNVVIQAD